MKKIIAIVIIAALIAAPVYAKRGHQSHHGHGKHGPLHNTCGRGGKC